MSRFIHIDKLVEGVLCKECGIDLSLHDIKVVCPVSNDKLKQRDDNTKRQPVKIVKEG